jgi:hypothetical protein
MGEHTDESKLRAFLESLTRSLSWIYSTGCDV